MYLLKLATQTTILKRQKQILNKYSNTIVIIILIIRLRLLFKHYQKLDFQRVAFYIVATIVLLRTMPLYFNQVYLFDHFILKVL